MTDQVAEMTDELLARGPGNILTSARQARGLTTRQVADKLHLLSRQIEALEANDYRQFNADIFVKGYLKSYAVLLNLDPDVLIQAYMDNCPASSESMPAGNASVQIQRPAQGYNLHYWALAAAVIVIAVLWFIGSGSDDETAVIDTTSPQVVVDKNITIVPEAISDLAEVDGTLVETEPLEQLLADNKVIDPTQVVTAEVNNQQANAVKESLAEDILEFSFTDDCWVEDKDSRGEMIFADLRKANSSLELSGVGPFDILLGYASGVSLSYNSEPVEIVVNRNNDLARLMVGEQKI